MGAQSVAAMRPGAQVSKRSPLPPSRTSRRAGDVFLLLFATGSRGASRAPLPPLACPSCQRALSADPPASGACSGKWCRFWLGGIARHRSAAWPSSSRASPRCRPAADLVGCLRMLWLSMMHPFNYSIPWPLIPTSASCSSRDAGGVAHTLAEHTLAAHSCSTLL